MPTHRALSAQCNTHTQSHNTHALPSPSSNTTTPLSPPPPHPRPPAETADDVLVEVELPFWIDAEDVCVRFGEARLEVEVHNTMRLHRTYWRST